MEVPPRWFAAALAEDLGIMPFIAKVMGHKLPGEAEIGDAYDRYDYHPARYCSAACWRRQARGA